MAGAQVQQFLPAVDRRIAKLDRGSPADRDWAEARKRLSRNGFQLSKEEISLQHFVTKCVGRKRL
jgi:hypothetical protein